MLCSNIGINESGHLTFAGEDTVRLAAHYKTPLYLMDEDRIRENCRVYKTAMERAFGKLSALRQQSRELQAHVYHHAVGKNGH